ncbi:extracellular electron transfer flavoprotein PplA [Listeria fleischmannii]|uniref:FMN-binding protein n=2 Tax=Listeria fleischmannii TaxID=1069827 RepID=A0A841YCH4_9LIST|nr:extracellular electron transfer flavoprotein PplA [Listeria fleischmannii]EIA21549.1 putative lipoprotein [Listeria fleischmannii subsp. coloradonensis]EUJ53787.1 putative lipoprotein [Listeria fleischmannii FSL S10-1203]MBC1397944.1 FMN-binding protein [Listeria fleischmannii]MBC1426005.1 FMN-binding protein [Listeria fleischmannii]STY34276.1 Major membrane immunogen, membrane-anchored lipoprotein [Listeria fleischmannii subsp. coloradonensis]
MELKKVAMGITAVVASSMLLVACGNDNSSDKKSSEEPKQSETKKTEAKTDGTMTDGTYKLEEKNFDDKGWKAFASIEVKDGKITKASYDYKNKDGDLKSEDADYEKAMKDKVGTGPQEYLKQLSDALVKSQSASGVDIVTGATHSSETFINYANQLIQAAQRADTTTISINNGADMKDGKYNLEEQNYAHGYRVVFAMEVKDGKIATSDYNYVNKDGQKKTDDADYEKNMKEKSGTGPQEYIPALNKSLVDKQSPAEVDTVSGATNSSNQFRIYAAQLENAAQNGDTDTIKVYNKVDEE